MKVFRKPNYVHVISEWLFLSPKETLVARRQTKNSSVSLLCPLIPLTDAEDETPSSKTIFLKSPYFLCWSSILSNTQKKKESAHFVYIGKANVHQIQVVHLFVPVILAYSSVAFQEPLFSLHHQPCKREYRLEVMVFPLSFSLNSFVV